MVLAISAYCLLKSPQ